MSEKIRAFIAVNIPSDIAQKLVSIGRLFYGSNFKGVSEKNIHLTLKFLGNVEKDMLEKMVAGIEKTLTGEKPFSFEIDGLGAFPSENRARVLWCGVKNGARELSRISSKVDMAVCSYGFKPEENYIPHVTIGRFRRPENVASKLKELRRNLKIKSTVKVDRIVVYRSTLTKEGPIYEALYEIVLKG